MLLRGTDEEDFRLDTWLRRGALILSGEGSQRLFASLKGDRRRFVLNNLKLLSRLDDNTFKREIEPQIWRSLGARRTVSMSQPAQGQAGSMTVSVAGDYTAGYAEAEALFVERFGDLDYFFENLMVSVFFYLQYPLWTKPGDLWRNYVNLCNLYGIFRFLAVAGCREEPTKEQLFHLLVYGARSLIHNGRAQASLQEEYFENDSADLAHMAILLNWA